MKKEYIITFCISFLVIATIVVIGLMILMPQQTTITSGAIEEYSSISKTDYTYKQTNAISFDNLVKEYSISDAQMKKFKWAGQFKPGNSDPFAATQDSTTTNSVENSNVNSNNTSSPTVDKITNSNGGVANPEATTK